MWQFLLMHGKNGFAEVSKNLARYTNLKIILLVHQNKCWWQCWKKF